MLFYRAISILIFPFLELYLFFRVYKKKEDKKRLKERFGKPTKNRPEGELIWLHAVSVGETNSVLTLVDELFKTFSDVTILFTTTTLTSAQTVAAKLPEFRGRVIHQFLPIDSYFCVKDFLNFWRPSKAIFVESEIWPNLISEARISGAEVFLVNARMSKKSAGRWYLAQKFGFRIFNYFNLIFVQNEDDKKYFSDLAESEVLFCGNLKSQVRDLSFDREELDKLKLHIGDRKLWLAASTHKGEESIIINAHLELKKHFPDLLTIIIPRHPNRAEEIKLELKGVNFAQRSKNQNIVDDTEIYLADSLGELGTFYRLVKFTFIGGSLFEIGGHTPFEAIRLGCAVISGRGVSNNKKIYQDLEAQNACIMIDAASQLAEKVKELFEDETKVKELASKAMQVIKSSEDIAEKIVKKINS